MSFLDNLASVFINPSPYHLLSLSALIGSQAYQSFIVTKITFITLPRPSFHTLQKKLFPIYFRTQSILLVLTVATFPGGPVSLVQDWTASTSFLVAGVTALLNLLVYGPRTKELMIERVRQSAKDNQSYGTVSTDEPSPEMSALNRQFSKNHAMSIHLNYITLFASIVYGWGVALRLQY